MSSHCRLTAYSEDFLIKKGNQKHLIPLDAHRSDTPQLDMLILALLFRIFKF